MTTQSSDKKKTSLSTRIALLRIWGHLSRRRRRQLNLLFFVMLASAAAQLISLGTVMPFLALLSNPDRFWQQPLVQALAVQVGWTKSSQLFLPVCLAFAAVAVLAALIQLTNIWLNGRLAAAAGSDLSCEAFRRTLYQPYGVHVQRNSAGLITGTTVELNKTVAALNQFLQLITSALVAISLLIGLFVLNANAAFVAIFLFGGSYFLISLTSRRQLRTNSHKIAQSSIQQLKALQEGLGAIRDVLLDGNQHIYLNTYRQADRPQRRLQAKNVFLGSSPRYALEALSLVAFALFGGFMMFQSGEGSDSIALLGALALGAQRLLPALQRIYSSWAALKSRNAALLSVLTLLDQPLPPQVQIVEPMLLQEGIRLGKVHFSYVSDQPEVLQGVNFEIRKGECIGFIGRTGSGKSTMVDLLMGLLEPTSGRVLVDGADLHDPEHPERLAKWRASIAHVPQSVYLADSSIAENIAFGVPRHHIDLALVKQAASQAQIASFIESNPEGYEGFVGERGIRLSGGQRQRIGIARALYKNARVLVLDEATSALDSGTEETVMKAISSVSESLTVIMISHRLSTLERCDRVIRLEQGTVSADGPPELVLSTQA